MSTRGRWRKALTISALVHCLLLAGVGWLGGSLIKAADPPTLMEVELISDPGRSEQVGTSLPDNAARITGRVSSAAGETAVAAEVSAEAGSEGWVSPTAGAAAGNGVVVAGPGQAATGGGAAAPKKTAAPRLLAMTEPKYPEEARQAGAEGTVFVRIEIKENGEPGAISIARSSGRASLDAAAVEAIRSWRFVPAQEIESGRAVRCFTTVSVVFRLKT